MPGYKLQPSPFRENKALVFGGFKCFFRISPSVRSEHGWQNSSKEGSQLNTRLWFQSFLFSPRKLGKWPNLTPVAYVSKWVGSKTTSPKGPRHLGSIPRPQVATVPEMGPSNSEVEKARSWDFSTTCHGKLVYVFTYDGSYDGWNILSWLEFMVIMQVDMLVPWSIWVIGHGMFFFRPQTSISDLIDLQPENGSPISSAPLGLN